MLQQEFTVIKSDCYKNDIDHINVTLASVWKFELKIEKLLMFPMSQENAFTWTMSDMHSNSFMQTILNTFIISISVVLYCTCKV